MRTLKLVAAGTIVLGGVVAAGQASAVTSFNFTNCADPLACVAAAANNAGINRGNTENYSDTGNAFTLEASARVVTPTPTFPVTPGGINGSNWAFSDVTEDTNQANKGDGLGILSANEPGSGDNGEITSRIGLEILTLDLGIGSWAPRGIIISDIANAPDELYKIWASDESIFNDDNTVDTSGAVDITGLATVDTSPTRAHSLSFDTDDTFRYFYFMINSSSRSAEFQVAQFQGVRTQVSEPGSLAILAVGLLGLGIAARRRRV